MKERWPQIGFGTAMLVLLFYSCYNLRNGLQAESSNHFITVCTPVQRDTVAPHKIKAIGLYADNSASDASVWDAVWPCPKDGECFHVIYSEYGRPVFQIARGDGPAGVGGPCDLGKLVRTVTRYVEGGESRLMEFGEWRAIRKEIETELSRCEPKEKAK